MTEDMMRLGPEKRFLVLLGLICLALIGGALYMQIVLGGVLRPTVHPATLCVAADRDLCLYWRGDADPAQHDGV